MDNVTSHAAPSLLKLLSPTPRGMSPQTSAGRAEEPLSQKPDLIRFASCSHKRMSFIWRSCQKQLQSRLRRNTKSPYRNTTAPSSRRDLLDLHRWGRAWVRDPREVYSRLPGRCLCSQEEDGDHGKHSFDCPTTHHSKPCAEGPEPRGIFLEVLGVNLASPPRFVREQ